MLKDSLDESYHVNMLISLLLRFPEIYTITFNVPSSSVKVTRHSIFYMIVKISATLKHLKIVSPG
mgnify:CR=1 FL=1